MCQLFFRCHGNKVEEEPAPPLAPNPWRHDPSDLGDPSRMQMCWSKLLSKKQQGKRLLFSITYTFSNIQSSSFAWYTAEFRHKLVLCLPISPSHDVLHYVLPCSTFNFHNCINQIPYRLGLFASQKVCLGLLFMSQECIGVWGNAVLISLLKFFFISLCFVFNSGFSLMSMGVVKT